LETLEAEGDSAGGVARMREILNLLARWNLLGDLLGDLRDLLGLNILGFDFGLGELLFLLRKRSCVLDSNVVILSTELAPKCKVVSC
jgi:hypothetical protein